MNRDHLPNFFIIGAPKCGTTSLYRYLMQHPGIYFPANKEPQFFCNDALYRRGTDYYLRTWYDRCEGYPLRGDATPHYLYHIKSALRIRESLGPAHHRFIVILRDPVARAWSHYWNMVQEGIEKQGFAEALKLESQRILEPEQEAAGTLHAHYASAGLYAAQLEKWFEVFERDRFLILFLEDLTANPVETVNRVFSFLDAPPAPIAPQARANSAARSRSPAIQRWIRQPSTARHRLGQLLPYRMRLALMQKLMHLNRRPATNPELDASLADQLRRDFANDIERLEEITGRELSSWKRAP